MDSNHYRFYSSIFHDMVIRALGLSPACHFGIGLVRAHCDSTVFGNTWKIKQHKLYGTIGIFIAGAVVFSALSIVPTNVYLGAKGGFPPIIPASFFYGLAFTETIQVFGFGFAVIMAILNTRRPDEHALWMTATVFFGLMPAWARLIFFPVLITGGEVEWLTLQTTLNIGISTFLIVVLYIAYRLKKLKHPAIILSLLLVSLMVFTIIIGEQEWYQKLITRIMKPTVPWSL